MGIRCSHSGCTHVATDQSKPHPLGKGIVPSYGAVSPSSLTNLVSASSRVLPHISSVGRRLAQTAGRSGRPKSAQRKSGSSCAQGIPAGLPCGMPGIGDEMLGAMQQAPQVDRQSMEGLSTEATDRHG